MERTWQSPNLAGGDEEAHRLASALAEIADAEFIESIIHAKSMLDRIGGTIRIGAYRDRFSAQGEKVGPDEPGTFQTLGYLYHYEHYNKLTNGPDEPNAKLEEPPAFDLLDADEGDGGEVIEIAEPEEPAASA